MDDIALYKQAYLREKEARRQAEIILENKIRDIYNVNKKLEEANHKLKQQQKEMIKAEKLVALGTLSAGVAHEINNPMAFIKSNINTLRRYFDIYHDHLQIPETPPAPPSGNVTKALDFDYIENDARLIFEELNEGVLRVQNIVIDLKSFARTKSSDCVLTDPNEAVRSALRITANQLKYNCTVNVELSEVPDFECNIGELSQVFINMLMNASHAVGKKGIVTIKSWNDDQGIHFSIQDDGGGIPAKHLDHIFTPFYTSKPVGKGTGLGLSVSYGIIENLGGLIEVESEVGHGTTFLITLPPH